MNREEMNQMDKRILDKYIEDIVEKGIDYKAHTMAELLATSAKYDSETGMFTVSEQNYKESYEEWYNIFKK